MLSTIRSRLRSWPPAASRTLACLRSVPSGRPRAPPSRGRQERDVAVGRRYRDYSRQSAPSQPWSDRQAQLNPRDLDWRRFLVAEDAGVVVACALTRSRRRSFRTIDGIGVHGPGALERHAPRSRVEPQLERSHRGPRKRDLGSGQSPRRPSRASPFVPLTIVYTESQNGGILRGRSSRVPDRRRPFDPARPASDTSDGPSRRRGVHGGHAPALPIIDAATIAPATTREDGRACCDPRRSDGGRQERIGRPPDQRDACGDPRWTMNCTERQSRRGNASVSSSPQV